MTMDDLPRDGGGRLMVHWSPADIHMAQLEGWDLFECFGSLHGDFQIQALDEAEILDSDAAAWLLVARKAAAGFDLHARALLFLRDNNPEELATIIDYAVANGVPRMMIVEGLARNWEISQ